MSAEAAKAWLAAPADKAPACQDGTSCVIGGKRAMILVDRQPVDHGESKRCMAQPPVMLLSVSGVFNRASSVGPASAEPCVIQRRKRLRERGNPGYAGAFPQLTAQQNSHPSQRARKQPTGTFRRNRTKRKPFYPSTRGGESMQLSNVRQPNTSLSGRAQKAPSDGKPAARRCCRHLPPPAVSWSAVGLPMPFAGRPRLKIRPCLPCTG